MVATTGCAGRWMAVTDPVAKLARDAYPRDYRVVLRHDSAVVLLDAVVRNDGVVEVPIGETRRERAGPPRGVALADVVRLELWQSGGERVSGGVALGLVAGVIAFIAILAAALTGGGS